MKAFSLLRILAVAAGFAGLSFVSQAVTVDSSSVLGTANLANSNEGSEFDGLDYLVDLYNGVAPLSLPATVTSATLIHGSPFFGATLPNPAAQSTQQDGNDTASMDIDLGNMSYDWLMAKWGGVHTYYYIAGLTGKITLINDVVMNKPGKAGLGLSHYSLYNGKKVPDSGATIALLGAALLALGMVRRSQS